MNELDLKLLRATLSQLNIMQISLENFNLQFIENRGLPERLTARPTTFQRYFEIVM